MTRRKLVGGVFAAFGSLAILIASLLFVNRRSSEGADEPGGAEGKLAPGVGLEVATGWSIRSLSLVSDPVNSLVLSPPRGTGSGEVYIGTTGPGGVYRVNVQSPRTMLTVSTGLGEVVKFGDCWVNRLAVRDLDGDGSPELIASTSQVVPRGRPRLYIWSLEKAIPTLRAMARPEIASSWSHGLAFLPRGDSGAESLFLTFCGYGEVVEYDYNSGRTVGGFQGASLGWKQVGQLPSSGEWSQNADVDNDGRIDVCLATGFAEHKAAIQVFVSPSRGEQLVMQHEINEKKQFGNVKFLVGDLRGDGTNDTVAWWCTDHLNGGDCEVIRYHLGPEGVRSRDVIAQGKAEILWPGDGQTALLDMDGNGQAEVWFAASSGNLWRYDPTQADPVQRVLHTSSLGPIAGGTLPGSPRPTLIVARDREVLRLDCTSPQPPVERPYHPGDTPPHADEEPGGIAVE
jgi:hypothetical protein